MDTAVIVIAVVGPIVMAGVGYMLGYKDGAHTGRERGYAEGITHSCGTCRADGYAQGAEEMAIEILEAVRGQKAAESSEVVA